MDNGCPECEELTKEYLTEWGRNLDIFCLTHQLEQADADVLKAMNRYKELKKKKEKQNAKCR